MNLIERVYAWRGVALALWVLTLLLGQPAGPILVWLVVFLVVCAGVIRVWARRYNGGHTRGSEYQAPSLVKAGPYSHMRHPLYFSNGLAGMAVLMLMQGLCWRVVPYSVALWGLLVVLACAEDRWLVTRFGEEWRAWARKVPLFGWRFSKRERQVSVSWWQAARADAWTWFWWVLAIAIAAWRRTIGVGLF